MCTIQTNRYERMGRKRSEEEQQEPEQIKM